MHNIGYTTTSEENESSQCGSNSVLPYIVVIAVLSAIVILQAIALFVILRCHFVYTFLFFFILFLMWCMWFRKNRKYSFEQNHEPNLTSASLQNHDMVNLREKPRKAKKPRKETSSMMSNTSYGVASMCTLCGILCM